MQLLVIPFKISQFKLYYQHVHLKYLCNLVRYWLEAVWGWHDSVETCSSVIICEIIVHLLVIVQNNKTCVKYLNCKLYYQQLHLKYWCNLVRYWLQALWGWHDSVETCSGVITVNCITNSCIWNTGVTWQGIDYRLSEDDTIVSKHVAVW